MKKTLSIILTVAMLVSMLSVAVFADTATPIATPEDFLAMQENGNYYLENNIDLGALSSSFALEKFSGTLDGKNYTVKYSISESGKYTGLIGSLTGTVKNLTVNASIVFETALEEIYAGAIAGYASGSSVIDSCTSEGNVSITFLAGAGFAQVGGIAGTAYAEIAGAHNATISNCKNNAQITLGDGVDNSDMEVYAGGIAAKAGKIKSCINTGAITLNTTDVRIVNAAGIVADETGSLNIEVCTNYGYVNAKAAFQANAGGIAANVGKLSQCIVSRCANFGNVNAEITGANINMDEVNNEDYPNIFAVSGGIVASQYRYAYLINSANYAAISASSPAGIEHFENRSFAAGISGKAYSNISNCFDKHSGTITAYYTGPVYASLNDTTSSIKGKVINTYYVADEQYNTVNASADEADVPVIIPEQKLSETASYKNFNFETIWEIKTEVGYPTLVSVPYHTHVYSDPVYNNDHTCVKDGTNHIECSCGLSLNVPAPGTASGIHTFINYEFSDNKLVAKCEYCEATDSKAVEDGWFMAEDGWMYFKDGQPIINDWMKDSIGWCYLGKDGVMLTNEWVEDSVGWCFVGEDGYCVTNEWKKDSIGWCYLDKDGRMATNKWIKDSVGWCFVGEDGYCVTNEWKKDSIGWCYLNAEGRMATNEWILDSVGWCYVGADGYCITNAWMKDSVGWCYLDNDGRMVTNQWVADSQGWCWLDGNGYWDGKYV